MGWVMMSERELKRVEIFAQIDDGRLSIEAGANVPVLSKRHVFRLLKKYRFGGATAVRHKAHDQTPNNQIHATK